jgi:hypothetical protein
MHLVTLNPNAKMDAEGWKHIKYMHHSGENWGDPYKVSRMLVFNIENMRIFLNKGIGLTCPAYSTSGHSPSSMHYQGKAADIRVYGATLLEMYITAERFNFSGIGLYPNNGRPFMHVDVRDHDATDKQARWIALPTDEPGKHWKYVGLTEENIRKYVV